MANSETVRTNIRTTLEAQERSVAWLARETGLPYKPLLRELKGETSLTLDTVVAVARPLRVEPETLLGVAA
jgi:DNA-binding phage protein